MEYVLDGGSWDKAQSIELIQPDGQSDSLTGADLSTIAKDAVDYSKTNPAASSKGYWKGKGANSTGESSETTKPDNKHKGAKGDQKGGKPAKGQSWKEFKKGLKHG